LPISQNDRWAEILGILIGCLGMMAADDAGRELPVMKRNKLSILNVSAIGCQRCQWASKQSKHRHRMAQASGRTSEFGTSYRCQILIVPIENRCYRSPMDQELDFQMSYTFKFIILGDTSVGKSCILSRFHDDHFSMSHEATIGVTFANQIMHIGTTELKLQLWDTAGQEIYRSITRSYYRDSHCAIIVCDLTKSETFASMADWVKDVRTLAPDKCQIVLVGNKVDLERVVTADELKRFAESVGCPVFETSAATGRNIRELFEECAMLVFTAASHEKCARLSIDEPSLRKGEDREHKARCC
jgi:Ras-related protein Rab-2A